MYASRKAGAQWNIPGIEAGAAVSDTRAFVAGNNEVFFARPPEGIECESDVNSRQGVKIERTACSWDGTRSWGLINPESREVFSYSLDTEEGAISSFRKNNEQSHLNQRSA